MAHGNLLIIDDEPLLLKTLKMNLEEFAENIFIADNGFDAIELFKKEKIDCIVCDINMPKMNGVQVIKAIRLLDGKVPFIFFTGHGNQELMLEAATYGAFDFINKPDFDDLEEVISRGLRDGFERKEYSETHDEEIYLSEYRKLLKSLSSE